MADARVAITGLGVVTPAGIGAQSLAEAVREAEAAPREQQVGPVGVEGDEEVGVPEALVAEEERHQLRLLVVDVPDRELADRLREREVELLRERLAANDLAVLTLSPPQKTQGGLAKSMNKSLNTAFDT